MRILIISLIVLSLVAPSCKKDPQVNDTSSSSAGTVQVKPTSLIFSFDAQVNNSKLIAASKGYTNTSHDLFTVSKLNYYISNLRLKREDGTVFAEPESYHLISHVDGKTTFTVTGVPDGTYTTIDFLIGVDAQRNKSGAQTGDLDVANGMFWDWDQGYVFFKMEGVYLAQNQSTDAQYAIHVGGFEGRYNSIQQCHFTLTNPVVAKNYNVVKISYSTIIDEIFTHPKTIGINDYLASPGDSCMKMVSDNYADMFQVAKIEN